MENHHCRRDEGQFDMVKFTSDEFSIVKLHKHIEEFFMPDKKYGIEVGCFFRHRTAVKVSKVCTSKDQSYLVGLHPNDIWSTKYFSEQMNVLATRCNFINPT